MFDFKEYISTLDIDQLRECRTAITREIVGRVSPSSKLDGSLDNNLTTSNVPLPVIIEKKAIEELIIGPQREFISVEERDLLKEECKSLNFKKYSPSDAVQNRFVTLFGEPYIWKSKNGLVVNEPISIDDFPVVKDILAKVNKEYKCNLNCCLITYFKNGSTGIRLHHDNEDSLDQTQPIVVVSVGAVRRIEFIDNEHEPYMGSDLTLDPSDCSVYVMSPGTQQFFRHRVRCNKKIHKDRLSFSFRAFVPEAERARTNQLIYSTPHPVTNTAPQTPLSTKPSNSAQSASALFQTPPEVTQHPNSSPILPLQQTPSGYSPYPPKSVSFNNTTTQPSKESNKKLSLILGSSITLNVSGELLSRGNRRVINCSETGANLHDVSRIAKDFFSENPTSVQNVDQIILNVGTNDIKYFNGRDHDVFKRFQPVVINLVKSLKYMFPRALIVFQSVLPIRIIYNYTARTVDLFNQLLNSVCDRFGCIFYNCFSDFIGDWEYNSNTGVWFRDYNRNLYRDKFHLKDEGTILLVRHLKCIIYGNIFNSNPRLVYHHNHFKKY